MQNDSPGKAVTFQIHHFLFFSSSIRSLHRHSQPFLGLCDTEGGKRRRRENVTQTSNDGRNIFKATVLTKKTISNSVGTSKDSERKLC